MEIIFDGVDALGTCGECGHEARVDPMADDLCPKCGKGQLVSEFITQMRELFPQKR